MAACLPYTGGKGRSISKTLADLENAMGAIVSIEED
jgi:hypothetical protein